MAGQQYKRLMFVALMFGLLQLHQYVSSVNELKDHMTTENVDENFT